MKNKISWIYVLTYFFLIQISGSNGLTTGGPQQDTKLVRAPVENDRKPSKASDTDDFSNEIQPFRALLEMVQPESRILRKRKSKKATGTKSITKKQKNKKKGKKNKKAKKAKKNKKKIKKKSKKTNQAKKRKEISDNEKTLESEDEEFDTENPFAEFPELDDNLDLDIDDTDISSSSDSSEDVDLYHKCQKYWDSSIIEPEYIISEWFAILDGKKFDRKNGLKIPYIGNDKGQFGTDYLLNKKKNSKYLMNKYSSGWKYSNGDDDKMDYVTPIVISNEALRRTFPDTKEDEIENRILKENFSDSRKQFKTRRKLKTYNSRRNKRNTTGSYDLTNDYKDDPSVVLGSYRKLTDSEMENYVSEKPYGEGTPIIYNQSEPIYDQMNNVKDSRESEALDDERNEENVIRRIKEKRKIEKEIERDREIENDRELDQELGLDTNDNKIEEKVEIPPGINPEMIGTSEKLEKVKEVEDDLDKRLDTKLDGDLDGGNPFSELPDLDDDLDLNENGVQNRSKRLNLNDNNVYEQNRIKKLSRRNCQKELRDLKKKYDQIVEDIKESTYL